MTDPVPVPFTNCFRWHCPACRAVNYVEPDPVTDPETIAAIRAEDRDDEGEEWKQGGEPGVEVLYGCMPPTAVCHHCDLLVRPEDEG